MGHDGRDERWVINVNSSHHPGHPDQGQLYPGQLARQILPCRWQSRDLLDLSTGPSTIHPADIPVPRHPKTDFTNLPRRVRRHHLRCGYAISRCYQLARTHAGLSRGRESCATIRSCGSRTSERNQTCFRREFGLFRANNDI